LNLLAEMMKQDGCMTEIPAVLATWLIRREKEDYHAVLFS
jgi:hypothetical protein